MISLRYDAVLFDLLTALLDSWSLWNEIAGDADAGRRWRSEYLIMTYRTGAYRPYEALVAEAAVNVGLSPDLAKQLDARYGELRPWPGVPETLKALRASGIRLGVVTNCSERLGRIAAANVGVELDTINDMVSKRAQSLVYGKDDLQSRFVANRFGKEAATLPF